MKENYFIKTKKHAQIQKTWIFVKEKKIAQGNNRTKQIKAEDDVP